MTTHAFSKCAAHDFLQLKPRIGKRPALEALELFVTQVKDDLVALKPPADQEDDLDGESMDETDETNQEQ